MKEKGEERGGRGRKEGVKDDESGREKEEPRKREWEDKDTPCIPSHDDTENHGRYATYVAK